MKIIIYIFLLCHISSSTLSAQKHDYLWLFSEEGNYNDPTFYNATRIDFNHTPPAVDSLSLSMGFGAGTIAAIADTSGQLQLYTNGCYIANANHDTIEGGERLNYLGANYQEENFCQDFLGYPALNGVVILPMLESDSQYVILHKDFTWEPNNYPWVTINHHLYCTSVDMRANNGQGKVSRQQVVMTDTLSGADVTAVRHANGQDWWFMTMKANTNRFYKFLLTSDTILGPFLQELGDTILYGYDIYQAAFSPDGKHYARVNHCNGVMVYDFDRATGELSNYRNITWGCAGPNDSLRTVGVAFSPNSRFLYISGVLFMFQVDLEASDVNNSIVMLDTFDGFQEPTGFYPNFFTMMHGPDCKIYITCTFPSQYLHVIHFPDRAGLACQFQQRAVKLPVEKGYNLPNFPHYRLDGYMPECDSTLSLVSALWQLPRALLVPALYPNPTAGALQLDVDLQDRPAGAFQLFDLTGRRVFSRPLSNRQWSYELDLGPLPPGLYAAVIASPEGERWWSGKVVRAGY